MELVSALVAIGKLFVDVTKEIRTALQERKKDAINPIELGSLLALYGSATRLGGYSAEIRRIVGLDPSEIGKNEEQFLIQFFREIHFFGENLKNMNLCVIDIYYPGLGENLCRVIRHEINVLRYFESKLVPAYNINTQEIPKILHLFLSHYNGYLGQWENEFYLQRRITTYMGFEEDIVEGILDDVELRKALVSLTYALDECRIMIANIVRENWDFKELIGTRKVD